MNTKHTNPDFTIGMNLQAELAAESNALSNWVNHML